MQHLINLKVLWIKSLTRRVINSASCCRWFNLDDRRQRQAVRRRGRKRIDGIGGDFRERGEHGLASQEFAEEAETPRHPQSWVLSAQPDSVQERLAEESAYTDALDGSLADAFLSLQSRY